MHGKALSKILSKLTEVAKCQHGSWEIQAAD